MSTCIHNIAIVSVLVAKYINIKITKVELYISTLEQLWHIGMDLVKTVQVISHNIWLRIIEKKLKIVIIIWNKVVLKIWFLNYESSEKIPADMEILINCDCKFILVGNKFYILTSEDTSKLLRVVNMWFKKSSLLKFMYTDYY